MASKDDVMLCPIHVWNLENLEYKAFRLPEPFWYLYWTIEMYLELFLVHGTKVVLSLKGIVLQYSFDTDTALITEVQGLILLVSLHATEDQFSVVSLKGSGIDDPKSTETARLPAIPINFIHRGIASILETSSLVHSRNIGNFRFSTLKCGM